MARKLVMTFLEYEIGISDYRIYTVILKETLIIYSLRRNKEKEKV